METVPEAARFVVAPGGRWLRIPGDGPAPRIVATDRSRVLEPLRDLYELATAYVWIEARRLVVLSYDATEERALAYDGAITGTLVDDAHVLVARDAVAELVRVPELVVEARIDLGATDVIPWRCEGSDLVHAGRSDDLENVPVDAVRRGACPRHVAPTARDLHHRQPASASRWISVSEDGAWLADLRTAERLELVRSSDGASIHVSSTTHGVLVTASSGRFEAFGAIGEHVVVRLHGPAMTAELVTGAAARERFERPGLLAAFFAGEPLPD